MTDHLGTHEDPVLISDDERGNASGEDVSMKSVPDRSRMDTSDSESGVEGAQPKPPRVVNMGRVAKKSSYQPPKGKARAGGTTKAPMRSALWKDAIMVSSSSDEEETPRRPPPNRQSRASVTLSPTKQTAQTSSSSRSKSNSPTKEPNTQSGNAVAGPGPSSLANTRAEPVIADVDSDVEIVGHGITLPKVKAEATSVSSNSQATSSQRMVFPELEFKPFQMPAKKKRPSLPSGDYTSVGSKKVRHDTAEMDTAAGSSVSSSLGTVPQRPGEVISVDQAVQSQGDLGTPKISVVPSTGRPRWATAGRDPSPQPSKTSEANDPSPQVQSTVDSQLSTATVLPEAIAADVTTADGIVEGSSTFPMVISTTEPGDANTDISEMSTDQPDTASAIPVDSGDPDLPMEDDDNTGLSQLTSEKSSERDPLEDPTPKTTLTDTFADIDLDIDQSRPVSSRGSITTDDPLLLKSESESNRPTEYGTDLEQLYSDPEDDRDERMVIDPPVLRSDDEEAEPLFAPKTPPPRNAPLPQNATPQQVEEAVEGMRQGVDEVDLTGLSSRESSIVPITAEEAAQDRESRTQQSDHKEQTPPRRRSQRKATDLELLVRDQTSNFRGKGKARARSPKPRQPRQVPWKTREDWRRMVAPEEDIDQIELETEPSPPSSGPSTLSIDGVEYTVTRTIPIPRTVEKKKRPVTPLEFDPADQPPPGRRGTVKRHFSTDEIDKWNTRLPHISSKGPILRLIFESWISEATAIDEPLADGIKVVNDVDAEALPPDMEYQYSNEMIYHREVPDPELGKGCGCDGPCKPDSRTCSCVKRQKLYFYDVPFTGFAYHEDGTFKHGGVPIWECGPLCGCPPECMNRVIQRGRAPSTKIDLFKTRQKGWGIKARSFIPCGTFLGTYSGELITEAESERRGHVYDEIGRTYLFDLDGYQIKIPPPLDRLRRIDPRLAELAERARDRALYFSTLRDEEDKSAYSAYSVDAFHWGNFTRYFNHSCDPNLVITQAYVKDCNPERPMLVIFTRRDVPAGQELCISYKGVPDEDEITAEWKKYEARKSKTTKTYKFKSRKRKNKTSAVAHVASGSTNPKPLTKDVCRCNSWNCDGRMWGVGGSDDGDEEEET